MYSTNRIRKCWLARFFLSDYLAISLHKYRDRDKKLQIWILFFSLVKNIEIIDIAKISKSYKKPSESVSFDSNGESKKSILASKGRSLSIIGEKMKAKKVTRNNLGKYVVRNCVPKANFRIFMSFQTFYVFMYLYCMYTYDL